MSKKTQYSSEYKTMLLSRFHESGMSTREDHPQLLAEEGITIKGERSSVHPNEDLQKNAENEVFLPFLVVQE